MSTDGLAVIFDIDGVLVDSYDAHFESWRQAALEWHHEMSVEDFAATFGRTSRDIIAYLWGANRFADDEIVRLDDRKEALYREIVASDFPAMPGAFELIESLHAQSFKLAVGSSGPPENVALAIEQLAVDDMLAARITGMDVTRGKPDPQVFLLAAERAGVQPENCAVVEDAAHGIEAAKAAGMASIALVSTGHTHAELAGADVVVDQLAELSPANIAALIERS